MVRGYVPEHVWKVLAELSFFFHQLCAKEISLKVVEELEKTAPELLCKLEKIFPPGFFLLMQHLILHLLNEVRMGGPMQNRWCYPIERCLKVLRKKCRNKARLEASMDLYYEARLQCHINHSCDVLGRYPGRSEARTMTLTREQYLAVSYKTLLLTHSMKNM